MSSSQIVLLFSAAVAGGAINSVAGGGGFIAFPALLFTGMPPVNANATNTIALWPGTLASTGAYRRALSWKLLRSLLPLIVITFLGSTAGAFLLLHTPQTTFMKMVPWLLLAATILFSFGSRMTAWIRQRHPIHGPGRATVISITFLQLCVAIYIGYFGAGVGIIMLALLAIMGLEDIHAMNGMKTLLATCGNGVAVVMFIFAHAVYWPQALLMVCGAIVGGYGGAYYAQKTNPRVVRYIILAIGSSMTAYFFWKVYVAG
ncbi:MAG: hypothetical protein DMG65_09160 [Candidatus Angelobacter sp. Gp1-AA117]|nr:MAG: hypothetical protein DMG65_09160 [Candidatus Angelobacter sp. Gp1-AA117]